VTARPLDADERRVHWIWLVLLMVPLVVAPFMEVSPERATLLGVEGPICPSRLVTDAGCPGCGLTRGTALVIQGRIPEALSLQPVALMVVAFSGLGVILRGDILWRNRMTSLHAALLAAAHRVFVVAVFAVWIGRLLTGN